MVASKKIEKVFETKEEMIEKIETKYGSGESLTDSETVFGFKKN